MRQEEFAHMLKRIREIKDYLRELAKFVPKKDEKYYQKSDTQLLFLGLDKDNWFERYLGKGFHPCLLDGQVYVLNRNNAESFDERKITNPKIYCIIQDSGRNKSLSDYVNDVHLNDMLEFWYEEVMHPFGVKPILVGCDCGWKSKKAFSEKLGYEIIRSACDYPSQVGDIVRKQIKDKGYLFDAMLCGIIPDCGKLALEYFHIFKKK